MTGQEARERLEDYVGHSVMLPEERERIMAAADAVGDARELKGHVAACLKKQAATDARGPRSCGAGDAAWYCAEGKRLQGGNAL